MINVAKPTLPPLDQYIDYLKKIWETTRLTNNGQFLLELEQKLKDYLNVNFVSVVTNGHIALQLALKSLDLHGEIITTPFTHISTLNSILWQNCVPVFADINEDTLCIDPYQIERLINPSTSAILGTHVYGYPCNISMIKEIADKHNLRIIYDGAHAFGTEVNGQSIFNFGDVSITSFHATKIFHTVEGGAVFTNSEIIEKTCRELRYFGLDNSTPNSVGINGINSEFHAAIGLCNLTGNKNVIQKHRQLSEFYRHLLRNLPFNYPFCDYEFEYNYAYFPVIFPSEQSLISTLEKLRSASIFPRRYFYPSLNKLKFISGGNCPVSENISKRVACLPLYFDLSFNEVEKICRIIIECFE